MGHIRYGRFVALSAAGLIAAGAGAVVTAQTGLNISAGELVTYAEVRGLSAGYSTIQPGHGPFGASDEPVAVIEMRDVGMEWACVRMTSIDVPVLGTVTVTAVLPEHATIHAAGFTIDASSVSGPMSLDGMDIAVGAAEPSERTGNSGVGLASRNLHAGELNVDLAGLHAEQLSSSAIEVRAERGESRC